MTGTHKGPRTAAQMDTIFNTVYNSNLSETDKITRSYDAVIAASNSPTKSQNQADYICDGIDDDITILEALDDYGNVKLTSGIFDIRDLVTVPEHCILSGNGNGKTTLLLNKSHSLTGENPPIVLLSDNATCENLTLNGNGWTDQDIDTNGIQLSNYSVLRNCEVLEPRQYAVYTNHATGASIINNVIHHTLYPITLTAGTDDESQWSNGCRISGNITYSSGAYNKIKSAKNCRISDNTFYQTDIAGGCLAFSGTDHPFKNITVCNNTFIDTLGTGTTSGISINSDLNTESTDVMVTDNLIDGFYYGIWTTTKNVTIRGNTILNCRRTGIEFRGDTITIECNRINCGINLNDANNSIIQNNTITGGSKYSSSNYSGIYLQCSHAINSDNNIIQNNVIKGCSAGYAIYVAKLAGIEGIPTNTRILYNDMRGNLHPFLDTTTPNTTTLKYNDGYITENTGTATIPATTTSITVTHGLAAAPTRVQVTPTSSTQGIGYYVSAKAATTFTITMLTAPTVDVTFDWRAEV